MDEEIKKLHQLRLSAVKMEIFFNVWIGLALALVGVFVGTWITGTKINWVFAVASLLLWGRWTYGLFIVLLAGKERVWLQEDRIQRLRDAERAFKGRGS